MHVQCLRVQNTQTTKMRQKSTCETGEGDACSRLGLVRHANQIERLNSGRKEVKPEVRQEETR